MPLHKLNNVCLPVMSIVGTKYLFKSWRLLILEPGASPSFYMGWVFIQTGGLLFKQMRSFQYLYDPMLLLMSICRRASKDSPLNV